MRDDLFFHGGANGEIGAFMVKFSKVIFSCQRFFLNYKILLVDG